MSNVPELPNSKWSIVCTGLCSTVRVAWAA